MPLYVVTAMDHEGSLALRMATRPIHAQYIRERSPSIVKLAGPFLSQAGEMIGSMLIVSTATLEDAQAFIARDPYTLAGLFASVDVRAWKLIIGRMDGGPDLG